MNLLRDLSEAITRAGGLHRVVSAKLAAEGLPAPKDWSVHEVGLALGTKIARDRMESEAIFRGLGSLHALTGDLGEARPTLHLYRDLSRVKTAAAALETVGTPEARADAASLEVGLWQEMKHAAAGDPSGTVLGLGRLALSAYADAADAGEKLAASEDEVMQFAASFACAAIVDDAIATMLKTAEVTPEEALFLGRLNAQAALNDLRVITRGGGEKHASDWEDYANGVGSPDPEARLKGELADAAIARKILPYTMGLPPALIGGAFGYATSTKNPVLGAGLGAPAGGGLGALLGKMRASSIRSPYEGMDHDAALAKIRREMSG